MGLNEGFLVGERGVGDFGEGFGVGFAGGGSGEGFGVITGMGCIVGFDEGILTIDKVGSRVDTVGEGVREGATDGRLVGP